MDNFHNGTWQGGDCVSQVLPHCMQLSAPSMLTPQQETRSVDLQNIDHSRPFLKVDLAFYTTARCQQDHLKQLVGLSLLDDCSLGW